MKQKEHFKLLSLITITFLANSSWAQVLPGAAMPETVSKSISNQQPVAQSQVLPAITRPAQPQPTGLPAQAQKIKFKLNGVILEGNHIYSTATLSQLYRNELHKTITVAELFNIVQGITNFYRNNGYILSRAILPPQHVKNGIVHIRVIEGYIGNVTVTGKPYGASCLIERFGNRIKACRPLELSRMEKYLLLMNEVPGVSVRAVLAPAKKEVGAADLNLVTQTNSITGYFSYDNYGTRYIGPQELTGNLAFNSIFFAGDATNITITKTPRGGELTYVDLNYNVPLNDEGVRWLLGRTHAHTHPLFILTPVQIDGINNNYYTTVYFPMIRTRSQTLTLRAGFNYLDTYVTSLDAQLYTDHVRSIDLGGSYNVADSWYGANLISADYREGLPILGYTSDTNLLTAKTSHPGGRANYAKFMLTASRVQGIKNSPMSFFALVQGQYTFNPLLSSEQFTFGGSQIGRGYDIAELIGDKGVAGSVELRWDQAIGKFFISSVEPYLFYDAGEIWNYQFVGGIPRKQSATSTGVGMRFVLSKFVTGNVMWTQPLTKPVLAEEQTSQITRHGETENRGNGKASRVFFSVTATLD